MPEPEDRQEPVKKMLRVEGRVYALVSGKLCLVDIDKNAFERIEVPFPGRVIDIAKIDSGLAVLSELRGALGFAILRGDTWATFPSPGKVAARASPVLIPWRDSMSVFTESKIWKLKDGGWKKIDIPYMYTVDKTLNHYWKVKSLPRLIHATHGDLLFVGWDKGEWGGGVVSLDLAAEEKAWRRITREEIAPEETRLQGDRRPKRSFHPKAFRHGPDGKLWMLTSFSHLGARRKNLFRFDGDRWERVSLPADLSEQPHIRKMVERRERSGSIGTRLDTYYVPQFCLAPDGTPYLNTSWRGIFALKDGRLELAFYCTLACGPMVIDRKRTVIVGTRSRGILVLERDGKRYAPRVISTARERLLGWGERDWMELSHRETVQEVVFSPDGQVLATGSLDGTIAFWEVATGLKVKTVKAHPHLCKRTPWVTPKKRISSLAFSPDGRYVASGSWDKTAALIEVGTGEVKRRFHSRQGFVFGVAFSPDGFHLATASGEGVTLQRIDGSTSKRQCERGLRRSCNSVAVSPCGSYVAGGGYLHAYLWDFQTGRKIRTFDETARSVTFSPDGKWLATKSGTCAVLWDVASAEKIRVFEEGLGCIRFSPDGRWLVTASHDRTVVLWDVETGAEVETFVGNTGAIRSVAISPDGRYLATGSSDGTARVWRLPDRFHQRKQD